MDVEAEIRELKRRVSELEGSFGFLTRQVQGVHKDLLEFAAKADQRFDRIDGRLDQMETRLEGRIDKVETELRGLRRDLPGIVGEAVRGAFRKERAQLFVAGTKLGKCYDREIAHQSKGHRNRMGRRCQLSQGHLEQ